jgi:hypothetical protein
MVQPAAKWTMIIGGIILAISIVVSIIGFSSVEFESERFWDGTAPDTIELDFEMTNFYQVYIEEGSNVTTIFDDSGIDFVSCEEDRSCDQDLYQRAGMAYVGQIYVNQSGSYSIELLGTGDVEIRETPIDLGAFAAIGGSMIGCCCGGIVLLVGIILAFTMKGPQSSNVMLVDPNTGMLVQSQPAAQVMETPGAYAQTYTTEQPVFQEPGQQPPGQQPPPQF